MFNLTKQEIEYLSLQAHIKMYQEYLMMLQDTTSRYLMMLDLVWPSAK